MPIITPRRVLFALIGGALGAALGASHILCPSGECALTGSWYGTGAIGAALGFLYADGCPACALTNRCSSRACSDDPPAQPDEDDDLASLRPRDDDLP